MTQAYQARRVASGASIDYTPSANVAAGQVVALNSLLGVAARPIAANQLGALDLEGIFDVVKVNGQVNNGAALYWGRRRQPAGWNCGHRGADDHGRRQHLLRFRRGRRGGQR